MKTMLSPKNTTEGGALSLRALEKGTACTAHLKVLFEQAMQTRFEAGRIIFEEGDPTNRFYAIEQGQIAVESDSPSGPIVIQRLTDGDVLGWSWLYAPYYSHFRARALEDTSAIFLYGARLREACESDPDLGYELTKRTTRVVIHRLHATKRRLLDVNSESTIGNGPI